MKKLTVLFQLLALLGCATPTAPLVQQTYNASINISNLKTFAWAGQDSAGKINPRYQQTLKRAVLENLGQKGYRQVNDQADFIVSAYINLERKTYTLEDASNLKRTLRTSSGEPIHVEIEEGGIVVSFLEEITQANFFRGIAKSQINRNLAPERVDHQIQMVTDEILKDFPQHK